ncbi:MAG: putative cytosol aminopeptidase [Chlamydiales bacterium]|nr:putative cytosol aminopeptidase [Chlamydiales bacterium]
MLFSSIDKLTKRQNAELIVLPFWQQATKSKKVAKPAAEFGTLQALLKPSLESGDFTGSSGEFLFVYLKGNKEKRVLLLGLGKQEDLSVEPLRQAFANVAKECQKKGISKINLVVPTVSEIRNIDASQCLTGIAEGILLTNYTWEKLATLQEETVLLKSICLVGIIPKMLSCVKECEHVAEGVYLARDLINGNADIVTPQYLAETAKSIADKFASVKATVLDQKKIEKEKMGLLLAVARGSSVEPTFIILSHKGFAESKDHTVLVGKGVTYDTGGLNLKPTGSMETMREDMSGAAAVLATVAVAAALNLKVNVTAVVAATENAIDSKSYKPGDVYIGHSGMTVEIGNTDAEGRLTLADALSYTTKHLKPTRMLDFATLTGSMVIALGEGMSGFYCNEDKLAEQLLESSANTSEILWRMPLHAPYKEQLKSDIADIKNIGGRAAGSITAALFLEKFVGDIPWAHVDIAGTAFASKEKGYLPKNGIGFGVRLTVDFLQEISKNK